jgi:hypothetical protein
MPKKLNLEGQRFGRLTVLHEAERSQAGQIRWACRCDCSNQVIVRGGDLRDGNTTSCGCFQRGATSEANTTHGHTRDGHSPTYMSWQNMLRRAENRDGKNPCYASVSVCFEWMTFEGFLSSMGERPEGTTLSRFGDVGNYEPSNCAWHTRAQQRAEARKKKFKWVASQQPQAQIAA